MNRRAPIALAAVIALGASGSAFAVVPPDLPTVAVELPAGLPQPPPVPAPVPVPVLPDVSPPVKIATPPAVTLPAPAAGTSGADAPGAASTPSLGGRRAAGSPPGTSRQGGSNARRASGRGSSAGRSATPAGTPAASARAGRPQTLGGSGARPRGTVSSSARPIGAFGSLPLPVPDWSKPIILALLAAALWFGARSTLAARRARRLEAQRRALAEDLTLLQSALIPDLPGLIGRLGVSVAYRPADGPGAGGDFYDAFELDEARVAVILGDASGHGRDALTRAIRTRYTLRAYVEAGLGPRAALRLAGQVLGSAEGDEFSTIAVAVHDAAAGTLSYATAGHPAPIVLGARARELPAVCESPPVGWGVPTGRRQTTISLPAGAFACFFSDGLTEARAGGEMLGRARLGEILSELGPDATAPALLERVRTATDDAEDDMAACIVTAPDAVGDRGLQLEDLEVDERELAGARAERFLEVCGVPDDEIAIALDSARAIAGTFGTALIHVRVEPTRAAATVTAPAGDATPMDADRTAPALAWSASG